MAAGHDKQEQVRAERARTVGLFRYSLIREAADPKLSTKQRGRLVRDLAAREHAGPFGQPVRIARATIDRWIRDWRRGGFDALVPNPRRVSPRTPAEVLDLAVALKKEVPARTAVQVAAILRVHCGWAPDERTLQRHFVRRELNTRPDGMPPRAFGRFEADAPNQRWTGDALHGPTVNGRKAILFAFIDDHSRLLTGYRWARREDTVRLEAALRTGLAARGIPASLYLDNGSAMVDRQLLRACASLGIRLIHSKPGQPAGRGKIERFFRTVREQFLVEIGSGRELDDLTQLGTLFTAWVETVYHRRVHSETGQTPIQRWSTCAPVMPSVAQLREAFLWSEHRTVTFSGLRSCPVCRSQLVVMTGVPRSMGPAGLVLVARSTLASLRLAASKLACRPWTSPSQPLMRASSMRLARLAMISISRGRCRGSTRRLGHRRQANSCWQGVA
jgi:putative transposase